MLARSRWTVLMLLAGVMLACGRTEQAAKPVAAVEPATILPPFQQEIASIGAEVTLPGVWKYGYRIIDHADTAYGAHRSIEFHYTADSAIGVPPRLLLVIRAFKKPAWEKTHAAQKDLHKLLTEHGGEVYAFSIVTQSPYPINSPSTLRVDQMMLALLAEGGPFRLTFKK